MADERQSVLRALSRLVWGGLLILILIPGLPMAAQAAPSSTLPMGPSGYLPVSWANTSVTTLDPHLANNTGFNFTIELNNGSLASQQTFIVNETERLGAVGSASIGFTAIDANGPTVGTPFVVLPNGTEVQATSTLDFSGPVNLALVHVHGWWWNASVDGDPLVGSAGYENGTYLLGTALAQGVVSRNGAVLSGPSLDFQEGGPHLPLSLLFVIPTVFGVRNGSAVLRADNGELLSANPYAYTAPVSGHNQSSTVPMDALIAPGPQPTTTNGITLWGNITKAHLAASGLVGVWTNDTAFGGNVTTGISFSYELPLPLPPGNVLLAEATLPLTTSSVLDLGYASLNYESVPVTVPEAAVVSDFGRTSSIYLDTGAIGDAWDNQTIVAQEVHGPWWNLSIDGQTFTAGSGIGGSDPTNGTLDLGVSTALGVNDRPFFANLSFATQPTMFSEGNITPMNQTASFQLQAGLGPWTTPSWGLAWTEGNTSDIIVGSDQLPYLASGQVLMTNTSALFPQPLANGTVIWKPGAVEFAQAATPSVLSGRNDTLTVWVESGGASLPGLDVSGVSSLDVGLAIPFTWVASKQVYTATYTAPVVSSTTTASLTITAGGLPLTVPLSSTITIAVGPEPVLTVQSHFPNGELSNGTTWGGTPILITSFVNGSGIGPVADASLVLKSNLSGGVWGNVTMPVLGEYQVSYLPPPASLLTLIVSAKAPLDQPSSAVILTLHESRYTLQLSSISVTDSLGRFIAGSGEMNLFVNVSVNGAPADGASVTFAFSPALPGSPPGPVLTDAAGGAELSVEVPRDAVGTRISINATAVGEYWLEGRSGWTTVITLTAAPSPAAPFPWTVVGAGVALGLALVVAVVFVGRRRRRSRPPAESREATETSAKDASSPVSKDA